MYIKNKDIKQKIITHSKKRFLSYAQDNEDLILYNVFNSIQRGTYIDVGANHPIENSVTKSFYDLGWTGINIEPQKELFQLLIEEREKDINLNVAAGSKNSEMKLFGNGGMATLNEEKAKYNEFNVTDTVKVFTLGEICIKYNFQIHFCKIDVEGFEKEVLEGFDFSLVRPWVFVIECFSSGTIKSEHVIWENILIDNKYECVLAYGLNRYYLAEEKVKELKKLFFNPQELYKMYEVYRVVPVKPYETEEKNISRLVKMEECVPFGDNVFISCVKYGLSYPEEHFTWTNGVATEFTL